MAVFFRPFLRFILFKIPFSIAIHRALVSNTKGPANERTAHKRFTDNSGGFCVETP